MKAIEKTHKEKDHGFDGNDHNHDDIVTRLLGPRAEVIFAVLAGVCLLAGWLGPKLNLLST
jgi:Cd2+/Zn2+-exporting ATPase